MCKTTEKKSLCGKDSPLGPDCTGGGPGNRKRRRSDDGCDMHDMKTRGERGEGGCISHT